MGVCWVGTVVGNRFSKLHRKYRVEWNGLRTLEEYCASYSMSLISNQRYICPHFIKWRLRYNQNNGAFISASVIAWKIQKSEFKNRTQKVNLSSIAMILIENRLCYFQNVPNWRLFPYNWFGWFKLWFKRKLDFFHNLYL